ncbi:MAG: DNA-binding response regulator [Cycloclasticus sp.]|nr:MAG: DNA-binding response regulator [Cycloclasticus sp.]
MNSHTIKVLLIDDHELVRSGIEHLLSSDLDIDVVAVGSSGEDAIRLTEKLNPDVILMDLNMPGIGGTEAIKRILRKNPKAKIIALSVYDDGPIPHQAINFGAKGYINKGCPVDEMIKAVTTVFKGGNYLSSDVATNLVFSAQDVEQNTFSLLSDRELQIVTKIVDGHKISDIADEPSISPKTVNTHRYRAHEKLGIASDIELVRLALDQGLLGN